MERRLV
jgi:hypothetical protein